MSMDREDGEEASARETIAPVNTGSAGWWISGIVAVLAGVGLMVLLGFQDRQDRQLAARGESAAQARLEAAAVEAQNSADEASRAAQVAVAHAADARRHAQAAARTAQSAGDAGHDAAATEPTQLQQ